MMEKAKGETKQLLADSLKKIMLDDVSFEKITIKDITSGAGLIRPTFYNHFQDKYELLEWIFYYEIIEPSYILLDTWMIDEALRLILIKIENEKEFFQKACKVKGQNSFENMVFNGLYAWSLQLIKKCGERLPALENSWLTPENISRYYANSLGFIIQIWITNGFPASADEMMQICKHLASHPPEDIIYGQKKK
jgi:probable dihydroxyacetone kinase regulator